MPESNKKKKEESKKHQEQKAPINVEGREAEQAAINQGNLNKKEPQGKEKGKNGGGLFKGIVNFIKGIADAIFDVPQREQPGSTEKRSKEDLIQPESVLQDEWLRQNSQEIEQVTEKNPENLSPETKQEVEKEGKRLKEGLNGSDAGDQLAKKSITPDKDHDNEEEVTPGGRGV